ncbi:MAG: hypothetical protein ACE5OO_02855, partial [Candidatus Bathyarchaeia archaeon]
EMFFELSRDIEKTETGYVAHGAPSAKPGASIPEVDALRRNASRIRDLTEVDRVRVKVCVTGPYTLASFFQSRNAKLFEDLGRAVAEVASRSMFEGRNAEVSLLCIDEPVVGFLNDPLLDYGSDGRDSLRRAWDGICRAATARGIETSIHLHDTSDDLFWEVEHFNVVETHVDDPLYASDATKGRLEETDKRLKASVCITLFDRLIANKLRREGAADGLQQRVAETWTGINRGLVDPHIFLEDSKLLYRRLRKVIDRFGPERVPYAGPECGLRSFPTYDCAMECLRRISEAAAKYNAGVS